jgi:nitroreductase
MASMETEKAIMGRRSVRDYQGRKVPEAMIRKILKAGAMAPSAMGIHPCRFIVIQDKKLIKDLSGKVKDRAGLLGFGARLAERMKLKEDVIFYGAPLLILIVAEKKDWAPFDCSLAAQNMMLRAYDLGLGSCFIGFMRLLRDDKETLRGLGIKDTQELYCPLIFGFPKGKLKKKDNEVKVQKKID